VDPWFTYKLRNVIAMEQRLLKESMSRELMWQAKRMGFSDEEIATLGHGEGLAERVRQQRQSWGIRPVYKQVDTCAAEFEAATPYFYSSYEQENEAQPIAEAKALVIGSGPIRIGQGIEFDYCSVHAAWALQKSSIKSILVNSNPETVSTDFDISDRLYFEPLDEESVRDILENEGAATGNGLEPPASVVQFGGQTAINLSQALGRHQLPILGSSAEAIDIASDRKRFDEFLAPLGIPQPPGAAVTSLQAALTVAESIGYPVLVRPSYVLGGRAMEIVHSAEELTRYMTEAVVVSPGKPVLIDKYIQGKECEVDAVSDGETVLIPGVMEHIERAGVHSGDSLAVYPAVGLSGEEVETLVDYTSRIGVALRMKGLMNVQFVIIRENSVSHVYVLEVNPRSSRTVPFISKVTGVPLVRLATEVMLGRSLREMGYRSGLWKKQALVAIKAPVFSMSKLGGVDTYLGPEMKSTGEVMGIDETFEGALVKSLMAAGLMLPPKGSILLSIADRDKQESQPIIRDLVKVGYGLYATEGTAAMLKSLGLPCEMITKKLREGHPNVVDVIRDGTVSAVINTISGGRTPLKDGFDIRRAAAERRIPCFTSLDTARVAVEALRRGGSYTVKRHLEYLDGRKERP
jgi:carbamoyl-phosphate synthase large subunit